MLTSERDLDIDGFGIAQSGNHITGQSSLRRRSPCARRCASWRCGRSRRGTRASRSAGRTVPADAVRWPGRRASVARPADTATRPRTSTRRCRSARSSCPRPGSLPRDRPPSGSRRTVPPCARRTCPRHTPGSCAGRRRMPRRHCRRWRWRWRSTGCCGRRCRRFPCIRADRRRFRPIRCGRWSRRVRGWRCPNRRSGVP